MKDGFLRVAALTPALKVADVAYNTAATIDEIRTAAADGAKLMVFPELGLTGYTCGDLFFQESLLQAAEEALCQIVEVSTSVDALLFVGLPYRHGGKLYNVAAAVADGRLLGLVPKRHLPNYDEFYELRHFTPGMEIPEETLVGGRLMTVIGTRQLFHTAAMESVYVACELCEDLWVPVPPSSIHAQNGANIIVNLSASNELIGKAAYRRELVMTQSARLYAGYIYASAGSNESTQDVVFSGHRMIAEGGKLLAEGERFFEGSTMAEIDVAALLARRMRMNTYPSYRGATDRSYLIHEYSLQPVTTELTRKYDMTPFVPKDAAHLSKRCEEIFTIQAHGLKKRLLHTGAKTAVIGISGGLDSTLALLVAARAMTLMQRPMTDILAITMPGFGTTDRTYENALAMIDAIGATRREISIASAVRGHFADIGHDEKVHDVTYENAQARERTQILMDVANETGGLVVGTGDLSELALGWATYNGDHMSMYAVNASVPKTLVRHLVRYYADKQAKEKLAAVLLDVLDTPVSPELLPPEDGQIAQKTEDLVGPYELHDFFLYYMMRYGFPPEKIFRLAKRAFSGVYEEDIILHWEKTFYRRFFAQQFKRSALPDGPKVGTVALSPRGDWRMPSDASAALWLAALEQMTV